MTAPAVSAEHLCKQYLVGRERIDAIANVSLTVERGEFLAVCGRSGSGKTTLMNLLALLERPDSGRYFLSGTEAMTLDERRRASIRNREIGFVFQLPTLLPRVTALENVALPLAYVGMRGSERRRRAIEALEWVGLADRKYHRPSQLSGGEQQRVAIARALVNNPSLILADEPTGALDTNTGDEIMSLFQGLHRQGSTILVVTHDLEVARRAERCVTLRDGRITSDERRERRPALRAVGTLE